MRDLHLPGRSVVMGRHGAAATSHFLSTLTAIDILRRGGNAADAAIAACAVQCVVEPGSTGIGGDNFVLYAPASSDPAGKVYGLNGSGRAPRGLTAEYLLKQGIKEIALTSVHAVTVPGAVDAWSKLNRSFGSMPLAELLQPAIRHAEEGFVLTERVATDWRRNEGKLKADANSARMWLKDGSRAPRAGEVFRQPEHAKVLREVAAKGRDGFYTGWVAEDIVAHLRGLGGLHALEDFATQEAFWVEPISTTYRGIELLEIPPSSVGITTLLMLNILSGFDLSKYDPVGAERFHIEAEATRLAFEARDRYVADPAFADVPVQKLLSAGFADELRGRIDLKKAMPVAGPTGATTHRDTVYISVVDEKGNACSFVNSLFWSYGTGLSSPKTGVLLQNRGIGFSVDPAHPNCVAPWKRPLHTIIPAIAMKDGRPWLSFGVMGGGFQPVGQSHVLTNILDFGMDVQEAIDCARGFHQMGRFEAERGIREDVLYGLAALGHEIKIAEMPHGGAQAIMIDAANGVLQAGSDPRKDGCALAY
ncbi:gamma-glutamyltranspeptidase/glutathione hydrolase [Sinorhizobium terangae]|uniref:Glutathione hydrolase proenzyme n=1 Tax=Sinorhizobium terangae TaxID=110322 RepID=A0A6N7LM77_SINTE|nr:gamma-glutamyltransferase [Sinorhizobium terangae]MBB4184910.1 gamma-glutamyltranspeptidase/glutathione hydrolase [Sinorhizobium terangae]MQX18410.1 gamma-glutamyltransferase [Sinorhizobium terangae]